MFACDGVCQIHVELSDKNESELNGSFQQLWSAATLCVCVCECEQKRVLSSVTFSSLSVRHSNALVWIWFLDSRSSSEGIAIFFFTRSEKVTVVASGNA